ncbi:GCN5-related N-acetyltransferase [Paludibacter propionicigenes WB4]|uniref:GCN5-related N-acetyltransferase n=1 Tax=Paludibacter propionicigenes (strain DSM 17365 / JCM 13257 / WB4) TaxID=694427 RepID=E4T2A2_PALPW|nr:GNAT family protein [Paludibacter propionicigenes]ADQ78846.1 GCN5-related N-acetyltransferase [Paludibacter propionicigenes WB4]
MIGLEKFTTDDFEQFISWMDTEKFMYQFGGASFSFPVSAEQLQHYIADPGHRIYRVVDAETGKVIGHGSISHHNAKNKSARLCRILIAEEQDRSKGYGRQLIRALLKICFEELALHRVDLGVFEFNKAAIRCYQSCGFQIEGTLRESFVIDGEYYSVHNMSILDREYATLTISN